MLGDFNIDLLKISSNHRYDNFFNILLADGYLPCITLPTRIDRTFTLIDNIYATSNFNNDCAGILTNKISDHQMIFLCRHTNLKKNKSKKYVEYEKYDNNKIEDFKHSLANNSIYEKLNTDPNTDPNENYSILLNSITENKNKYIPKIRVKFDRKKHKQNRMDNHGYHQINEH